VITGIVSYQHGLEVVRATGSTGIAVFLVPIVPDLMIVTSSLTLMEAAAIGARRPRLSTAALVAGIVWTVAMNVAAGWRNGPGGALIAAAIPVAFVLTFESFLWLARRNPMRAVLAAAGQRKPPEPEAALALLIQSGSRRVVADLLDVPKSRVDTWARKFTAAASPAAPQTPAAAVPPSSPSPPGDRQPPRPVTIASNGASRV
jgi:hypothetical protein